MWQLQPGWLSRAALDAAGNALGIGGVPVTTAIENVVYAGFTVTATGGTPGYTYSVASGALPAGITLNSSSGVVSGTPTTAGAYASIVIRATDAMSAIADLASFTLTVTKPPRQAMLPDVFINFDGVPRTANVNGTQINL